MNLIYRQVWWMGYCRLFLCPIVDLGNLCRIISDHLLTGSCRSVSVIMIAKGGLVLGQSGPFVDSAEEAW